jgi:sugar phosphate permease
MGSGQILALFFFYMLTTVTTAGVMALSAVAVIKLYGTDLVHANIGLTGYLIAAAAGVLAGGFVADQSAHHNRVAALTLVAMAALLLVLAFGILDVWSVVVALSLAGFCYGVSTPSRDLLVRAVTPKGAIGTAFGFTSTGLSLGNGIGPVLCGWVMDHGRPDLVFIVVAAFTLVAVLTVVPLRSRGRPGTATGA